VLLSATLACIAEGASASGAPSCACVAEGEEGASPKAKRDAQASGSHLCAPNLSRESACAPSSPKATER